MIMSMLIIHATWDLIKNLKMLVGTKMVLHVKLRDQNISKWLSSWIKMTTNY